jgi:hypothetical protein
VVVVLILNVLYVSTPVPFVSAVLPVDTSYQSSVAPADAVPTKLRFPVPQRAEGVVEVTVGTVLQVIVLELLALLQPAAPVTVRVAENEPLATDGVKV